MQLRAIEGHFEKETRAQLLEGLRQVTSTITHRILKAPYERSPLNDKSKYSGWFHHHDSIHVKTIASTDSEMYTIQHVPGLVLRKNVSHKKAVKFFKNPRLLLLAEGIMHKQARSTSSSENDSTTTTSSSSSSNSRIVCFDDGGFADQEKIYINHCVQNILALGPNVIFASSSVSRLAQDLLAAANITLVLNLKMHVLENIARYTRAKIIRCTERLDPKDETVLGTVCHEFRVETFLVHDVKSVRVHDDIEC
jgi:chaperonin GroEL (HSP60 family)